MSRSSGLSGPKISAEENLWDYAKRLRRHTAGRIALHIKLSALSRLSRNDRVLKPCEVPLRALLKTHQGELFKLSNKDLVFVINAPRTEVERSILNITYLLRDDMHVRRAIDYGAEDKLLYDWYDLDLDYETFLDLARMLKEGCFETGPLPQENNEPATVENGHKEKASDPEDNPSDESASHLPKGYVKLVHEKPEQQIRPLDADAFARLERALTGLDVGAYVCREPIMLIKNDGPQNIVMRDCFVDPDALVNAVMPGYDLKCDPWFSARLINLLSARLIASEVEIDGQDLIAVILRLSIEQVKNGAFLSMLRRQARRTEGRLVIGMAARAAFARPLDYEAARRHLMDHHLGTGLLDFDPLIYAMRDRTLLASDFDSIDWTCLREWEETGDPRLHLIHDTIRRSEPARLILGNCDGPDAIESGQSLGIRLFSGPYIHAISESA